MRGLVMIIMALDHTRDLIHIGAITGNPTDLSTTTPLLFFTRWTTHLCAPTFVFLSGSSAYLSMAATANKKTSRAFLLKRGLWLIFLEFTLVNFGIWFDIHFSVLLFDVIAAIGFGFIVLGLLLPLPPKTLGIIGLIIIFAHNAIPLIPFSEGSVLKAVLSPFFTPTAFPLTTGTTFVMGYPPVPWLGIMLLGFSAGKFFLLQATERKRLFFKTGLVSLGLFLVLRGLNIYGDPVAWSGQKNALFTALSFINVTKYPPSLLFCLLTLGIMLLLFALMEGMRNKATDIISVFGKVPLFYFLVHWYLIHPLMFLIVFAQGYSKSDLVFGFNFGRPQGVSGVDLWAIYLIWVAVVVALYPLCKWYAQYKHNHKMQWWLRYL